MQLLNMVIQNFAVLNYLANGDHRLPPGWNGRAEAPDKPSTYLIYAGTCESEASTYRRKANEKVVCYQVWERPTFQTLAQMDKVFKD